MFSTVLLVLILAALAVGAYLVYRNTKRVRATVAKDVSAVEGAVKSVIEPAPKPTAVPPTPAA